MNNAVDIVIPYYNKKKFIDRAIGSVMKQPQLSIVNKIIVVDDGSDKEDKDYLFDKYGNNSLVRIIRQPNRGLFKARVMGLNCCNAPFVCFLDADDELYSTWSTIVAPFIDLAPRKDCPILAYEMCCQYEGYTDYDCTEPYLSLYTKWSDLVKDKKHFDHSACNKLIPRDIYTDITKRLKAIPLPSVKLNMAEDVLFMTMIMSLQDSFIYSENFGYIYHKEAEGSILKTEPNFEPFNEYFAEVAKSFNITKEIAEFVKSEIRG